MRGSSFTCPSVHALSGKDFEKDSAETQQSRARLGSGTRCKNSRQVAFAFEVQSPPSDLAIGDVEAQGTASRFSVLAGT